MASGIWTSTAGAAARAQEVEVIANNLANADTVGFKKDQPTFKEYMSNIEREHGPEDIPRGPFKDKDFYPLDGRDQAYVVMDGTYTNFRQGSLRVSQSPMDVAMEGPGFLEVSTPAGNRFTRQGSLKVSRDGLLVTTAGNPVLSADAGKLISLKDKPGKIAIAGDGSVFSGDEFVARLSIGEFGDTKKLTKSGGGLYENREAANRLPGPARSFVRQGMIEMSNVNPVEEMVNLIQANRMFEHDLKAMKTYGEMMGKEATEVGKL